METSSFKELNLDSRILRAIAEMGFEEASPIQAKAIPVIMEGIDIIGQAQTGTGKTAAFGIPLLQKVNPKDRHLQGVILCPTRELAIQVSEELRSLAKFMHGIKILPIYGGQDITNQIRSLKSGVQIVVGTPGRVMDHMRRSTLKLSHVSNIVLDEADEMLNMGFREDIETILADMPEKRQTVLFSATMPTAIKEITSNYQKNAQTIKVTKKELTVPSIEQYYYEVRTKNKPEVLTRLLDIYSPKLSLVFCNTKRGVDELVSMLQGRGYFAEGLHGDMKQQQRDRVMKKFRDGKTDILVATDVAARGIDVDDVEAVFNYDLPQDDEYYVHRIGRTGRAGRTGKAFTFVFGREVYKLKDIQRHCKTKIICQPVPSLLDVTDLVANKTLDQISDIIKYVDLSKMIDIIDARINEEDYTALDVAAAFLKMTIGEDREMAKDIVDTPSRGHSSRDDSSHTKHGMTRLFIDIGRRQNIRPGDILGAVAGESGIPGHLVGSIDMYDKYTFVDVPKEYAEDVIEAMQKASIKGKSVHIERAKP